jgi:hypothetical protein
LGFSPGKYDSEMVANWNPIAPQIHACRQFRSSELT